MQKSYVELWLFWQTNCLHSYVAITLRAGTEACGSNLHFFYTSSVSLLSSLIMETYVNLWLTTVKDQGHGTVSSIHKVTPIGHRCNFAENVIPHESNILHDVLGCFCFSSSGTGQKMLHWASSAIFLSI